MRNALGGLGLLVFAALALAPVLAQDITKGSIAGVVRDQTGAIVPGAKVTLNSPFGQRSTVSGSNGSYSFPNLVVGRGYSVSIDAPGFRTAKLNDLEVRVNQQTTADAQLEVGTASETVEVTAGGVETVDLATTTIGANMDQSVFRNVPIGRNVSSVMYMAPGVVDSGGAGTANPSINGASGLENQYIVNGANITDPGFGGFGTFSREYGSLGTGVNFDFVQEVQVKTGGFEAQYGQAMGGVVNVLTKSGGNAYHGSFYGYFEPRTMEAAPRNINDYTVTPHTIRVGSGRYDFGGDMGGYVVKDKLFWYAGFNPQFLHTYRRAPAGFVNASLGTQSVDDRILNYQAKINFNLTSAHQFEGSVFGDPSHTPVGFTRFTSIVSDDLSRQSGRDYGSRTWTGRYNGVVGHNWVLTANYSNYFNNFTENPATNTYEVIDNIPVQEGTGGQLIRNGLGFLENTESHAHQVAASASKMVHAMGTHTFDFGYQHERVNYDSSDLYTGPNFTLPNLPEFGAAAGQTQYGARLIRTHMDPADPASPIVLQISRGNYSSPVVASRTRYHAAFVEDSWVIGNRLTIKPGVRWEQQEMGGNAQRYVFAGNWAPRIGVIFDPTGSRRSKIFANWGRFFERIPLDIAIREFSMESSMRGAWYKDPGPDATSIDLSPANYVPGGKISLSGATPTIVAGGTKAAYQEEVVGGYEHEFSGGMSFSGRFVYRHLRRVLEDVSGINVTQALAGVNQEYVVANPSASLDIYTNAFPCTSGADCDTGTGFTSSGGALVSDGIPDGFPNATRIYKAMELQVTKRFGTNWQLFANYQLSKLYGNYEGLFRNDNQQQDPNISSSFDFTNTDGALAEQYLPGVLPADRRHVIKLFSNYQLGKSFNFGVGWNLQSGSPISKFLAHPVYDNSGEIPVGGRGSLGRTDWTFPLDVHADYTVPLGEQKRLKFVADFFNVFNQLRTTRVDQNFQLDSTTPNPDFLKPNGTDFEYPFQDPFAARVAVRFEF